MNRKQYIKKYRKIHKKEISIQCHNYYLKNKNKIRKQQKKYEKSHKRGINQYKKKYRKSNKYKIYHEKYYKLNRDKLLEQHRKYYKKHKKYYAKIIRKCVKKRLKKDIKFRLRCYLANRIYQALKNNIKSKRTIDLLGCSIDFLKHHLEKQFKSGMAWSNYGKWHIDHIKPCASFDLSKPSEQRKCFHYTNLQPLWAKENKLKTNKY